MRIALAACLVLIATASFGGPWPRDHKRAFVSNSMSLTPGSRERELNLFAEYGLTPTITLGYDAHSKLRARETEGFAFLRMPIGSRDATWRTAVDAGVGLRIQNRTTTPLLRLGMSVGRGFDKGWFTTDVSAQTSQKPADWSVKGLTTLGYSLTDGFAMMGQVSAYKAPKTTVSTTATMSGIYTLGKGMKVVGGVSTGLKRPLTPSVSLGLWTEF